MRYCALGPVCALAGGQGRDEFPERSQPVVGAGGGLWLVLDAPHGPLAVTQGFHRAVEQAHGGDLHGQACEGVGVQGARVGMRGDGQRPVGALHRVVDAVVPAAHPEHPRPQGHPDGQVTRARMTQIMNLLLLAPDIQEKLLNLPQTTSGRDTVILGELQTIALQPDWTVQQQMWYELYGDISQK